MILLYPPEPVTPLVGPPPAPVEPGSRCYVCADAFAPSNPPARILRPLLSLCSDCLWVLKAAF